MKTKPKSDTIGAIVMRRELKTSGLNSTPEVDPDIKKKPNTTIKKPTAIKITLILPRVKRGVVSILVIKLVDSKVFIQNVNH